MELSKEQINKIIKTLPVGYYIKRQVNIKLNNEDVSYYSPMKDEISISYNSLINSLRKINKDEIDMDIEEIVRTLVYHEVSHALLTPKKLEINDIINIFEDERIESLLKNYYKKVNFKKFVKLINNYKGENPKSPPEEFYQVVRYRIGKEEYLEDVHNIIISFKSLDRNSDNTYCDYYKKRIYELYNKIINDYKFEETNKNDLEDIKTNIRGVNDINSDYTDETITIKKLKNITEIYSSNKIIKDINLILSQYKNINKNNSSAINSYSGVFSPLSVVRDDYKYFLQKSRNGHIKLYSKLNLNLFIDTSGSFYCNDIIVNKILYALSLIEKENPNFSYNLITMSEGQIIQPKNNREINSRGGNNLTNEIYSQFKQVQSPSSENINIVLFDGYAFTDTYDTCNYEKRFEVFNTNNTIIISNSSNKEIIKKYCKNAKSIISYKYSADLYTNIIKNLQKMI